MGYNRDLWAGNPEIDVLLHGMMFAGGGGGILEDDSGRWDGGGGIYGWEPR
jgi:hypothetical protein